MTIDETRKLGIEFERRVQTMIPEAQLVSKLDTETIYSYINQYQDKFVHDIYKSLDGIPTPSKVSSYIETILQGLLTSKYYNDIDVTDGRYSVVLPEDFGLYLNSTTTVANTYSFKQTDREVSGIVPNTLISKSKVDEFITRPQDNMRIMRQPIAYLDENRTITVFCDRYTEPIKFGLSYYKVPSHMNLFLSKPCELPFDAFDDLVTGAVDLYVQYVAGAEARKRQVAEQQWKQDKKSNESE